MKLSRTPAGWVFVPTARRTTSRAGRVQTPVTTTAVIYADDELEFLRAVQAYKTEHRRPFPTWSEILGLLKSMGYHK